MKKMFKKTGFDIIIQAGQSNSEGCGVGSVTEPFVPSDDIWYLNNNLKITQATELGTKRAPVGNFSLSFAAAYIKKGLLQPGRRVLILRTAIGGTGFLDKRWGMKDDLFLKMMEMIDMALKLNPDNKLVAFLWHQGETDAILNASEQGHFDNLSGLVTAVRSTFCCGELPFIAGDFVQHWKMDNLAICEPVIMAMKRVCESVGHAKFVETGDLQSNDQNTSNNDTIHFSRQAVYELGERYFEAFCDVTK